MKINQVYNHMKTIEFIFILAVFATGASACGPLKSPLSNGEP